MAGLALIYCLPLKWRPMLVFTMLSEFDFHRVLARSEGPALVMFVDGRYHAQIQSEVTPPKMRAALEAALAAAPQDEP